MSLVKVTHLRELNPTTSDILIYENCFCDRNWRYSFGVFDVQFNLGNFVQKIAFGKYPELIRLAVISDQILSGFVHINFNNRTANTCLISGGIKPSLIGRGLGPVVLAKTVDYCFNKLGVHKIISEIQATNAPSKAMFRRAGFHLDGVLRDHEFNSSTQCHLNIEMWSMIETDPIPERISRLIGTS